MLSVILKIDFKYVLGDLLLRSFNSIMADVTDINAQLSETLPPPKKKKQNRKTTRLWVGVGWVAWCGMAPSPSCTLLGRGLKTVRLAEPTMQTPHYF
jgi:hypothetical protein